MGNTIEKIETMPEDLQSHISEEVEMFEKTGIVNKVYKVTGGTTSTTTLVMAGKVMVPVTNTHTNPDQYFVILEGTTLTADRELWEQISEGDTITVQFNQDLHITSVSAAGGGNW
jgi:mannose-6-phosphate isomerase-like protein (cupin superfamily)